ncbi:MAG TPA: hypothetical protein VNS34_10655 [Rhizobiaceae bacterium]|nr:hypothetical protein [Rhizobiaceae bacterium]
MHTIKNLVNSPYDIRLKDGTTARLPARGEITVEVDPLHLPFYRTLGYFEIRESAEQQPADDLARLRADYTEVTGKKPFMGWDAEELQKRIDAALEG